MSKTITEAQGEELYRSIVELEQKPRCPHCKSTDLLWSTMLATFRDDGEIEIPVECQVCNRQWLEAYTLSAVLPVEDATPTGIRLSFSDADYLEMMELFTSVRDSCEEALDGRWDRNDEGFIAMLGDLDKATTMMEAARLKSDF